MHKIFFLLIAISSMVLAKPYTDMLGRFVEVPSASKLVFIGPGALRMGVYLGLEDRLVGIEKTENEVSPLSPYRTFLGKERIAKLPIVGVGGPGKMPDLEALMVHKPDLIIASFVDKNQMELIQSKTGIPVLSLSYGASYGGTSQKNLEDIKHSLVLLGNVCDKEERANTLVKAIESYEQRLSKIVHSTQKLYVGGIGYKGTQGITSTEVNYPPFELLGLKNSVFEGKSAQGHQFIEIEALLFTNPDIIFIDLFSKEKVAQEYAQKKPLFDALKAYQTKNVKEVLGFNNYSTNVENLLVIGFQIASYLGANVDLESEANAIFKAFYGEKGEELLRKLPYGISTK